MREKIINIDLEIQHGAPIEMEMSGAITESEMQVKDFVMGGKGTTDYQKLKNLPSINGVTLFDNYDETDPTVPQWAKEENKPSYTAEEIGALGQDDEMSIAEIKSIWDSVFSQ